MGSASLEQGAFPRFPPVPPLISPFISGKGPFREHPLFPKELPEIFGKAKRQGSRQFEGQGKVKRSHVTADDSAGLGDFMDPNAATAAAVRRGE